MNETTSGVASKLESMLSALPFGATLGPILVALIILVVGLMIAKFIRRILRGSLGKVAALNRKKSDGSTLDLATPIVTIVYYVIVFLVLMAVLGQLGLTSVLDPLKEMANQFVAYIPNVIGAGIVGYIGYMIATLVSDFWNTGHRCHFCTGNSHDPGADARYTEHHCSCRDIAGHLRCGKVCCVHPWWSAGEHER